VTEKGQRLLDVLWRAVRDLERYRDQHGTAEVLADRDLQRMILHAMYEASQAAIDLGIHVLVTRGEEAPESYQQVFALLASARLIRPQLAGKMRGWAGLRNVLAHFYPVLDVARIDAVLRGELGDLEEYANALAPVAQA
jgi:uncharacterized protein YutE (UPF0331/DUF86 family)